MRTRPFTSEPSTDSADCRAPARRPAERRPGRAAVARGCLSGTPSALPAAEQRPHAGAIGAECTVAAPLTPQRKLAASIAQRSGWRPSGTRCTSGPQTPEARKRGTSADKLAAFARDLRRPVGGQGWRRVRGAGTAVDSGSHHALTIAAAFRCIRAAADERKHRRRCTGGAGSPTVSTRGAGAQLDVITTPDDPVQGSGSLMVVRFKALAPRHPTNIAAMLNVIGRQRRGGRQQLGDAAEDRDCSRDRRPARLHADRAGHHAGDRRPARDRGDAARELVAKREKEAELRAALRDIRRALDAYRTAAQTGHIKQELGATGYPPDLKSLYAGVEDIASEKKLNLYFLRRIPRDPFFPDARSPAEETWGLRSYQSPPDDPQPGDDVFDVYSLATGRGLNGVPYHDW